LAVKSKVGISGTNFIPGNPKTTRQGCSKNTKHSATSRNNRRKRYRGQGR